MNKNTETNNGDRPGFWRVFGMYNNQTPVDQRNSQRFTMWCLAWAAAIIAATWIIKGIDTLPATAAWIIATAPNLLAFAALVSYMRFLRMTDEMQRRIQIEGLAVGFGVGWIFAIGYLVMQSAGAPELPVTAMILVMTGGWIAGNLLAIRHYR